MRPSSPKSGTQTTAACSPPLQRQHRRLIRVASDWSNPHLGERKKVRVCPGVAAAAPPLPSNCVRSLNLNSAAHAELRSAAQAARRRAARYRGDHGDSSTEPSKAHVLHPLDRADFQVRPFSALDAELHLDRVPSHDPERGNLPVEHSVADHRLLEVHVAVRRALRRLPKAHVQLHGVAHLLLKLNV